MKKLLVVITVICTMFTFTACNDKKDEKPEWDSFYENARYTYAQFYHSDTWDIAVTDKDNEFIEEYEIENPEGEERVGLINVFTYKESPDLEVAVYSARQLPDLLNVYITANELYKNFMDESKNYYFNKMFIKDGIRENFQFDEYTDINKQRKKIGGYIYHMGEEPHEINRNPFQIGYTFTRNGETYRGLMIIEFSWVFSCTVYTFEAKEDNFNKYSEEIYWFIEASCAYCG